MSIKGKSIDGLLNKLDSIVPERRLNIDEEDKIFCERTQEYYESRYRQLKESEENITALHDLSDDPTFISLKPYTSRTDNQITVDHIERSKSPDPFAKHSFSFKYDLAWIRKNRFDLTGTFSSVIVKYFCNKYKLKVEVPSDFFSKSKDSIEVVENVRYEDVVEEIFRLCGDIDLIEVGAERVKKLFRDHVYFQDRLKISGNKISVIGYFYYSEHYSGGLRWGYSEDRLEKLLDALVLFEAQYGKKDKTILEFDDRRGVDINVTSPTLTRSLEHINSIRFFKNGRFDIEFVNVASRIRFYDFIEFAKLPQGRC